MVFQTDILGNLLEELIDYRGKTPVKTSSGIPLVTAKIIKNGVINEFTEFIAESDYDRWMVRGFPKYGDVVLTTEAPLGEVAQLDDKKIALAQRVVCLRGKSNLLDNTYLKYYFLSQYGRKALKSRESGTTVTGIKQSELRNVEVRYPSFQDQRNIASILSSLDDKIAVNKKICENLEAQAQALFKHWFVDFAPFKNGKFVESELGMIPEGWRVGTLGEMADVNPLRTIKKGETATYLDMKNMPTSGSFPINWEDKEFAGGMKFKNGDTLMARITPCLENGKVAYVNFLKDEEIAFGSTEYIVLAAKEPVFPELLYTLCRFPSFVNYAVKNMNGSSGRQRVSGETISNYRMVIAPEIVYSKVRLLFQNYMLQIRECGFENLRLATLRDTLLPKLMSGQFKL